MPKDIGFLLFGFGRFTGFPAVGEVLAHFLCDVEQGGFVESNVVGGFWAGVPPQSLH
jgi:hypothetical protein